MSLDANHAARPHSRSRHHRRERQPHQPISLWLRLVDAGLVTILVLTPAILGSRFPVGQLVFSLTTVGTAMCWFIYQSGRERTWRWTGHEWLWILGLALAFLQTAELPTGWLQGLSPRHQELLGEWSAGDGVLLDHPWRSVSFAPEETLSGGATWLAYALFFLIFSQRVRTQHDVDTWLSRLGVIAIGFALFSFLHFYGNNGKFFWVITYPFLDTTLNNLGTFSNRNHFAHFLALGLGPLIWCWFRTDQSALSSSPSTSRSSNAFHSPASSTMFPWTTVLWGAGIGIVLIAMLLTKSRGGALASAVALVIAFFGQMRVRQVSRQFVLSGLLIAAAIGGAALLAANQGLANRVDVVNHGYRWRIWQANIELARQFPWVGTGVGTHAWTHQIVLPPSQDGFTHTHAESSYLQVASECGLAGSLLAVLMIAAALRGPTLVFLRSREAQRGAAAVAVLAGLCANLSHAWFDFLWYCPGCMVIVLALAVIGARVFQLERQGDGESVSGWRIPFPIWGLGGCGLAVAAWWMVGIKFDAAVAEGPARHYQNLVHVPDKVMALDDDESTQRELQLERVKSAVLAAKADRQSATLQSIAAFQYLKLFDQRQLRGDMPMSLTQLRDAARASGFESQADMNAWFKQVVGPNQALLDSAWRCARRAVEECPLEASAYLTLAELSFRQDMSGKLQERLLRQALKVRPFDSDVRFSVGQEQMLLGREAEACESWRIAFQGSNGLKRRIADLLVSAKPAAEVCEILQPDWKGCIILEEAYEATGNAPEHSDMLMLLADRALQAARAEPTEASVPIWLAARKACNELQRLDLAVAVLQEAVQRHPHQVKLRTALGQDLYQQGRYAAAARHLKWAVTHKPDDAGLRQMAEMATREALRPAGERPESPVIPASFTTP